MYGERKINKYTCPETSSRIALLSSVLVAGSFKIQDVNNVIAIYSLFAVHMFCDKRKP